MKHQNDFLYLGFFDKPSTYKDGAKLIGTSLLLDLIDKR